MSDTPPFLLAGLAEALERMRTEAATAMGVRPAPRRMAGTAGSLPRAEPPVRLGRQRGAAGAATVMPELPLDAEALQRTGLALLEARLAASAAGRAGAPRATLPEVQLRTPAVRAEPALPPAAPVPALAAPARAAQDVRVKRGFWPFRR